MNRGSLRAVLLALVLLPALVYFALYAYIVAWTGMTVGQALPRIPICLLVLLAIAQWPLRGRLRRLRLTGRELRLVFALCGVGLAACGVGWAMSFTPTLGGGLRYYGGQVEKGWLDYLPHLPTWALVQDEAVVSRFFLGHSTLFRADHLRALAVPVFAWCSVAALLLIAQLCLSEILRAQWVRRERLTFPLVYLPHELTRERGRFWRNRWMWAGFAVAALLNLHNGLAYLYPALPEIRIKATRFETPITPPWTGLGRINIAWYPFVIGIGYLLSTDVSFSLWFFHWLAKLQMVVAVWLGLRADGSFPAPDVPYLPSQGAGAFLAIGALALWRASSAVGARQSWPRWAAPGLLGSWAGIVWFVHSAGVPWLLGVAWVVLHGLMTVAVARLVAEAGAPLAMTPVYPQQVIFDVCGRQLAQAELIPFSLFRNLDELYTDALPIHTLSGAKLLESDGLERPLPWLYLLVALVGLVAGVVALCDIYFRHGVMNVKATWPDRTQAQLPWQQLDSWLQAGPPQDHRAAAMGVGAVVMALLMLVRQHVLWWPAHPIGYAVAGSYAIQQLWLPLLLAWALKSMTLRAGGLKLYRRLLPAALGLILGDLLIPQCWTIVGVVLDQPMYFSFPS